jgi:hypothetical protein
MATATDNYFDRLNRVLEADKRREARRAAREARKG